MISITQMQDIPVIPNSLAIWGLGQMGVAIKGGNNNEHHNHNDVGSYVVGVAGHAYVLDPGGEVYTRRTFSRERYVSPMLNSYGHPVPVVAGQRQTTGRQSAARVLDAAFTDAQRQRHTAPP